MLYSRSSNIQNSIVGGGSPGLAAYDDGLSGLGLTPVGLGTDGNAIYTASTSDDTSSMFIAGYATDGTPLWSWSSGAGVASITDPTLNGGSVAAASSGSGAAALTTSLSNVLDKIFGAYNAQQTIDLNKQRLAAGLPPVNPSALAPTVNFGLSSNTLLLVGGALALYMIAKRR